MIIFGSRGIRMKGESGSFFCPQCGGARQYTRRKLRRFFTLYFIPVIPLDVLGEYIECNYCQGTFRPEVLQFNPQAEQRRVDMQLRTAQRRALLSVLIADGAPSAAARAAALSAMQSLDADERLTAADVDAMVDTVLKKGVNAAGDVAAVTERLDYGARETLIRMAVSIALADGALSAAEERQVQALAKAAELTDAHLTGIMATAPRMAIASPAS